MNRERERERESYFAYNAINEGDGLNLLRSLPTNSAKLVFFDPQYEKVSKVLQRSYPLKFQSDEQISQFCLAIERVLKPSAFCLLWVNKAVLGAGRVVKWLASSPLLKAVDLLVWYKANTLGMGSWFRSQAEFAFLLQKVSISKQAGEHFTNRKLGNVWVEGSLPAQQRKHPHQKPKGLIKALVEATTEKGDLIVDPCAGSFIVLDACQELGREFLGCDLTYQATQAFINPENLNKFCSNCLEFTSH